MANGPLSMDLPDLMALVGKWGIVILMLVVIIAIMVFNTGDLDFNFGEMMKVLP